ncbi:hypothetical protein BGZ82_000634 [Podila clonocystis]|nr:hypothetical protein BGZ82_000634 [Podila clonocystis]
MADDDVDEDATDFEDDDIVVGASVVNRVEKKVHFNEDFDEEFFIQESDEEKLPDDVDWSESPEDEETTIYLRDDKYPMYNDEYPSEDEQYTEHDDDEDYHRAMMNDVLGNYSDEE